jgi:hypothetical protein
MLPPFDKYFNWLHNDLNQFNSYEKRVLRPKKIRLALPALPCRSSPTVPPAGLLWLLLSVSAANIFTSFLPEPALNPNWKPESPY